MTSSPSSRPFEPSDHPQFIHSATEYAHYEAIADPEDCLHLPEEQCDHRTFRCVRCCAHP